MDKAHLKCFSGHDLNPCNPHGLQLRCTVVSTINEDDDFGPNPKAGTVEQNMLVTGALTAEAKCCGAESFTKFMRAFCINEADSINVNFPQRFKAFLRFALWMIFSEVI